MTNQVKLAPTPLVRLENLELLRHLAHNQFVQEEIGSDQDFEKLWRDAFVRSSSLAPHPRKSRGEKRRSAVDEESKQRKDG